MNIYDATDAIKKLYTIPNSAYSSEREMEKVWKIAIGDFYSALNLENDSERLEACILDDPNWELSVDERIALAEKAKILGAGSKQFLKDYYGYLTAHLDPSPKKDEAALELRRLMEEE